MGWEKWLLSYHVHLLIYSSGSQTFSSQGPPKHKWDHGPQFDRALSQGPPSEKSFTIRSVCLSICLSVSPSLFIVVVVFITTLFFWGYAFFSISTTNLLSVIIASFMVVSSYRVDKICLQTYGQTYRRTPSEILQNTFVIIPGPHFPIMTRTQNTQGEALTADAATVGNECVI